MEFSQEKIEQLSSGKINNTTFTTYKIPTGKKIGSGEQFEDLNHKLRVGI